MTVFAGNYVNQRQIENKLSAAVVVRICDDDNSGSVESDEDSPLGQLGRDAEAMFEGYCRGTYDLNDLRRVKPNEAVRLVLDCAEFLAAKRFPRAMNRDWTILEASVRAELKGLRRGDTRFDVVGAPEPASNEGGYVSSGDPENQQPVPPATFRDHWGSF